MIVCSTSGSYITANQRVKVWLVSKHSILNYKCSLTYLLTYLLTYSLTHSLQGA